LAHVSDEPRAGEGGLALRGTPTRRAAHLRREAHVEQPVGLVKDHHGHASEVERATLDVSEQSPGRPHDDRRPPRKGALLRAVWHTAVDRDLVRMPVLADRPELARHLERELPCGHDDQRLRTFQRRIDPLQDRNRERGRLSGPRLRLCEEVTAVLQGGYCTDLYRRGRHETKLVDGFRDVRVYRELAEASRGWCEGQSVSGF